MFFKYDNKYYCNARSFKHRTPWVFIIVEVKTETGYFQNCSLLGFIGANKFYNFYFSNINIKMFQLTIILCSCFIINLITVPCLYVILLDFSCISCKCCIILLSFLKILLFFFFFSLLSFLFHVILYY